MKNLFFLCLILIPSLTFARTRAEKRQERQAKRIESGVQNESINNEEAARLEKEQNRIDSQTEKFASDGEVSKKEKARLERSQNRASKHIYRAKHNKK